MALEWSSIGVNVLLNIGFTVMVIYIAVKRLIIPVLEAVIDTKMEETDNMMKAAASALGSKSGEVRQLAKLEEMVISDVIAEYPEIELALDRFSPETAEYMRENPRAALVLYQRYKPFIDQLTGAEGKTPFQY